LARRNQFWIASLVSLALAQVAVSLLLPRGEPLTIVSDIIQSALLLIAAAAYLPKTSRTQSKASNARLFWILMTTGMAFWLAYQGMWNYFEVIKREDVPDPFLGDVVLFLHLVPMIAALGALPHIKEEERDERLRMLDFSLLLTWWVFIYIYLVIPFQTVAVDEPAYVANFNFAYLTEKIVLLVALAGLVFSSQGGWQRLYAQLLGASALYAASSYVANWAIGHKTYYSGSIYDIPLTASVVWLAAVPAFADRLDLSGHGSSKPVLGLWITRLGMLALFSLPWVALCSEFDSVSRPVKTFRITVTLFAMVVMGIMVFWRQRVLRNELSFFLDRSRRSLDDLKTLQGKLIQSEKLASLGQLVGGAAHEINNPLTAMLGYSDLLSASNLPSEEQQEAARIGEQVRRTKALVGSLLTFARPAPSRLVPVDINSVLGAGLRLLASQLEAQGITIRLRLASSLPPVMADSGQLLHVCLHLARQIADRLDSATRPMVFVRTCQEGNSVLVDFIGDAPLASTLSFDWTVSSQGINRPSTLSLSACCRIIEEHGGQLLRPSNVDVLAYRVALPIASTSAAGQSSRAAAHSGS